MECLHGHRPGRRTRDRGTRGRGTRASGCKLARLTGPALRPWTRARACTCGLLCMHAYWGRRGGRLGGALEGGMHAGIQAC